MTCPLDIDGLERSGVAIAEVDAAGRIVAANAAWQADWHDRSGKAVENLFQHVDRADAGVAHAALTASLQKGTVTSAKVCVGGKPCEPMLLCFWPNGDGRGTVLAAPVSEPQTGAAMHQQLSGLMQMTSEALLTTDRALAITSCNRGAELIFGYDTAELIGRSIEDLMPARYRAEHRKHVEAFSGDPRHSLIMSERGEIRGLRKDGSEFPAEASIAKANIGGETAFTIVLRDATERRRFESALKDARWAAEQASMAKSQFLATMSHELRTPLNAIIGFAQVIENRLFGADLDRYVAYAADIRSSGQHLLEMINDILDLSRIESGFDALQLEPVNPARLIDASILLVRERARIAGVTLSVSVAPDLPDVPLDRRRMRQVLINLLTNAIKFTPAGGQIVVRAERERDGVSITVSDTGVGIPSQHLDRIMDPFTQVPEHRALNPEGMGLGLSIVRRICETHGGRVEIASTVGKGTIVKVWVPLAGRS